MKTRGFVQRVSHSSVALDAILNARKAAKIETKEAFATRIGMSLSTLMGYSKERSPMPPEAVAKIVGGLPEPDGLRLLEGHLTDSVPKSMSARVQSIFAALTGLGAGTVAELPALPASALDARLPAEFLRAIDYLKVQGLSNQHLLALLPHMAAMLGMPDASTGKAGLENVGADITNGVGECRISSPPPATTTRRTKRLPASEVGVPADTATTTSRRTSSTRSSAPKKTTDEPTQGPKPRAAHTRRTMRAIAEKAARKPDGGGGSGA